MLGNNYTRILFLLLLCIVGVSLTIDGAQGALNALPEALDQIQKVEVCIHLYQQLLLTPDILISLDKITLSSHNLDAVKKLSELSGLDLIQSTTLVKYCLYKQMDSLAGIKFEMLASIICGFDNLKKILSRINLDKEYSVFYNLVLIFLLFYSNIIFFDPFYSLLDIYCLIGMVSKLPPSGGGGGSQFPFNYPNIEALTQAFYQLVRDFAYSVWQVSSGVVSTQFYSLGNAAVQVFAQNAGTAIVGLGVIGTTGYLVVTGPSNIFQILHNGL